jgi:hypothetical protein
MPFNHFKALVDLFSDVIISNVVQANRRYQEPVYPKMVAATGIRVLAGGNYDDLKNPFGTSKSSFYYCTCNSLDIGLPTTPVEWEKKRTGLALKSVNQVLKGCVV